MHLIASLAVVSWFIGGILLGLSEIITLPSDPISSTLLQLLPLLFLVGGVSYVLSKFQYAASSKTDANRWRRMMTVGWIALFGVDAGVASLNNISTKIFHTSIPYYFQGVNLAQKLVALTGIFVLGLSSIVISRGETNSETRNEPYDGFRMGVREKPITNFGFVALLLGVVLGLAQYWYSIVFGSFILLLAGAMLYPIGKLLEKDVGTGKV